MACNYGRRILTQTSPWFRLTASAPGWEIDETNLYIQGTALLLLCLGLVLSLEPQPSLT